MALKQGGRIFFKLPLGHPALGADTDKPLVSQPPCRTAVQGIINDKFLVAMGGEPGSLPHNFNGANAVESTCSGGPQLDLVDEVKNSHPFSIKSFFDRVGYFFFHLSFNSPGFTLPRDRVFKIMAESPGVAPGYMDLESMRSHSIHPPQGLDVN